MALADLLLGSLWQYLSENVGEVDPDTPKEEAAEAVAVLEQKWAHVPQLELDNLSPADYLTRLTDPAEWLALLQELARRDALPAVVREAAAARREILVPLLLGLLDRAADAAGKPAGSAADAGSVADPAGGVVDPAGKLAQLAVVLLADLRAEAAIPVLVRLAAEVPEFTDLGDGVVGALEEIGEPAREGLYALCEQYAADVESVPYSRAVEILTRLPKDDRTWTWLKAGLQQAQELKMFYAVLAGDYGDSRAVFHLNTLLTDRSLSEDDRQEIAESVALCGGVPQLLNAPDEEEH